MPFYELPRFEVPKLKAPRFRIPRFWKNQFFWTIILVIFVSSVSGFISGVISSNYFSDKISNYFSKLNIKNSENKQISQEQSGYIPQTSQEEAVMKVVREASPSVVSIIITKNLSTIEQYSSPFEEYFGSLSPDLQNSQNQLKETKKVEVGGGTGFIISQDGLILTNKHVVSDKEADYTVLTNDGKKIPAKVLALDPTQDLAIIQIEGSNFPVLKLGDSSSLQIGQSVIAIGNALGEFRNTVSVGVISGLGRSITAGSGSFSENLEDIIQTDAAVNAGNSGGPLLNLKGEVIGIDTATAIDAQNIGFAIPINYAKKDIEQVKSFGKIVYPFLGVRYVLITEEVEKENNLSVDYGAWIQKGKNGEAAIVSGSPAEKSELKEGDIVLEFNGEKITTENTLAKVIIKYNPGDKVTLKIKRGDQEKNIEVVLGERSE